MYEFNAKQLAWLEALESGKYEQITGALYDADDEHPNGAYCCLGVGAEVCGASVQSLIGEGSLRKFRSIIEELCLRDGFGSLREDHYFEEEGSADCLAEMNDEYHMSFKEIAEYIRANPEKVFKAPSSEVLYEI